MPRTLQKFSVVDQAEQFLDSVEAHIPNLSLLLCLEPSKKFSVGGGWWWVGVESDFSVLLWAKP